MTTTSNQPARIQEETLMMHNTLPGLCIAFNGMQHLATGTFAEVALKIKEVVDSERHQPILMFDARSSELLEVDTRGSASDVALRYASTAATDGAAALVHDTFPAPPAAEGPRARGRPRLGVVAREVTLLPRHWDWLASQPGGASVALRMLVDGARRSNAGRDTARASRDAAYKFMSAIASSLETFEEASRALFAGDRHQFETQLASWPADVRSHALVLAHESFNSK
jgi:hypothetical protein